MTHPAVRLIRILGVASMVLGVLLLVTYFVTPLRILWWWYRHMPMPLQIGFGVAGAGLCILLATMLLERAANRKYDNELKRT